MNRKLFYVVIVQFLTLFSPAMAAQKGTPEGDSDHRTPVSAWWTFDRERDDQVLDKAAKIPDRVNGNLTYVDGVTGKAGRFDGYTTFITRQATKAPQMTKSFTIEAWIAPQTYSWNWTGIVAQAGDVIPEQEQQGVLEIKAGLIGAKWSDPNFKEPTGTNVLEGFDQGWSGGLNDWSARWRGYIEVPYSGEIKFSAVADNGLKLEINGEVVIDGMGRNKSRSGKITLQKGKKYPIVLSYYQNGDPSILKLYWAWQGHEKSIIKSSVIMHTEKHLEYVRTKELGYEHKPKQRYQRVFFGIDSEGHVGMKLMVNGEMKECISEVRIPLLRWSHIVGAFDGKKGIQLYINGKPVGSLSVQGSVTPAKGYNLLIGRSYKKMAPTHTERSGSQRILSPMIFDGLIDELKIHHKVLSLKQVKANYESIKIKEEKPLQQREMPSGPEDVNPHFGACYCRLRYDEPWEQLWRAGPDPDILVVFDNAPVRMVFWRGTSYGAVWVTENGRWMGDQSLERTGEPSQWGCAEHMSDKQCRYSRVKIIENSDARVVVHWRYAISDITYNIVRTEVDGWGEWADEYYYIYPDAVSTRRQILHSNDLQHEWQETIALHQPGTRPEDNIKLEALTWGNMDGRFSTYTWKDSPGGGDREIENPTIQVTNLKSEYKPFIIYEPPSRLKFFSSCVEQQWSHFPWWNHWPVSQIPNDGRRTGVPDRPAHSSLSQALEDSPAIKQNKGQDTPMYFEAVTLYGMTTEPVTELVTLARSWNYPAELNLSSEGFINEGFSKYQRAYILKCKKKNNPSSLKIKLSASEKSPVVNPAFVIKGWGNNGAKLEINGKKITASDKFRLGHRYKMQSTDLIVWIEKQATEPIEINLLPVK